MKEPMCIAPVSVKVKKDNDLWQDVNLACKKCWQCKQNKINDYVGRGLCEAAYSDATCALTLTYADQEDLSHEMLTPRHFQLFLVRLRKYLRSHGVSLRYFVAGEYGGLKGRAHFHAVLFFKGGNPMKWPQRDRFWDHRIWPYGHMYCDWITDHRTIRYVAKYLMKEEDRHGWFSLSKKPMIGWDFFADKAQEVFDLRVMPRSFAYQPPQGRTNQPYYVSGATRRDYLLRIVDLYEDAGVPLPECEEFISDAIDKAIREREADLTRLGRQAPSAIDARYWRAKRHSVRNLLTGRNDATIDCAMEVSENGP